MDPARGKKFLGNISSSTAFRKKFGGLYVPVTSALKRLGGGSLEVPSFIVEKVDRVRVALVEEERLLSIMRAEVEAREARATFLCSVLANADNRN